MSSPSRRIAGAGAPGVVPRESGAGGRPPRASRAGRNEGSPGGPGGATNPEQLFAAGYAACFQSALAVIGRRAGVETEDSLVEADVSIAAIGGGGYGPAVALKVSIPGADADTTLRLAEAAHQVCPYSNATRGNIEVTVEAN